MGANRRRAGAGWTSGKAGVAEGGGRAGGIVAEDGWWQPAQEHAYEVLDGDRKQRGLFAVPSEPERGR